MLQQWKVRIIQKQHDNKSLSLLIFSVAKAKGNDMGNMVNNMGGVLPRAIYRDIVEIHDNDDIYIVHGDTSMMIR